MRGSMIGQAPHVPADPKKNGMRRGASACGAEYRREDFELDKVKHTTEWLSRHRPIAIFDLEEIQTERQH